ncbi:hypothetical protein L484_001698 [Morus notabilis]|uniref:Uncharacterized protein n=1 Tax=Morus notabilis TaxID=981085 RepID=W9QW25_9ROSA|nr:hypothetical protein L484_001698 [Morus notabilis]
MIPLSLNPIQFSSSLKHPIFRPNPSLFKSSPDQKLGPYEPISPSPKELNNSIIPASLLMPHLQNLFQQTSIQQVETTASERERLLLMKISELQARMNCLTDELTAEKLKYIQLQQQLIALSSQEENGDRGEGGL